MFAARLFCRCSCATSFRLRLRLPFLRNIIPPVLGLPLGRSLVRLNLANEHVALRQLFWVRQDGYLDCGGPCERCIMPAARGDHRYLRDLCHKVEVQLRACGGLLSPLQVRLGQSLHGPKRMKAFIPCPSPQLHPCFGRIVWSCRICGPFWQTELRIDVVGRRRRLLRVLALGTRRNCVGWPCHLRDLDRRAQWVDGGLQNAARLRDAWVQYNAVLRHVLVHSDSQFLAVSRSDHTQRRILHRSLLVENPHDSGDGSHVARLSIHSQR